MGDLQSLPLEAPPEVEAFDLEGSCLEYEETGDVVSITLRERVTGKVLGTLSVNLVDISYYAKQHLLKRPSLLDCGVAVNGASTTIKMLLIPTGRTRKAGNGSIAVKYIDVARPVPDEEVEKYERVAIRPPSGIPTYAYFEASYLASNEDQRKNALFVISPSKIVMQFPMTEAQRQEYQTWGGKKVLYFDVLGAPNLQSRDQELKRMCQRSQRRMQEHEERDLKWEQSLAERRLTLEDQGVRESDKPKLSKKAKQKARQVRKKESERHVDTSTSEKLEDDKEKERIHKEMQAESRDRSEFEKKLEKEQEVSRRKNEAAQSKLRAEAEKKAEEARKNALRNLLAKVSETIGSGNDGQVDQDGTTYDSEDGLSDSSGDDELLHHGKRR